MDTKEKIEMVNNMKTTIKINAYQEIRIADGRNGNFHLYTDGFYNATFESEAEARQIAPRYGNHC